MLSALFFVRSFPVLFCPFVGCTVVQVCVGVQADEVMNQEVQKIVHPQISRIIDILLES